ncbi:esterase-like activity of phytase family protein [Acuticoccus sp. MNP-M23]|uniref:esterase-like activity of phytase family protein n=1 Tax=Acuticoccus sp. MNP-M23 TaxID=3072793 RepID=UPI002815C7D1|nr:esterase-like activity of phytase family protein [Acuticoccus sp. MNP-M23]WMS42464.1 esterase-like activity of phytase family protein [Acuticoccus sp. MNP-M23]
MKINHLALGAALLATTALTTNAHADAFNRIASFAVMQNLPDEADPMTETSPEIIDATEDGMMLVYSDSPLGAIGMIDITDPAAPQPRGAVMLDGEPTSLVLSAGKAFVAVNTSESFTAPSGILKIVDLASGTVTESCDLGGQPDSAAVAPDGTFLAIAIENERDEDLNDGAIPQMPAGSVAIIPLEDNTPDCDNMVQADVTGLADVAPGDPEPEFVDINGNGQIVVTLQENNHIAVLDRTGKVLNHFSAGAVSLDNVETAEEGAINFAGSLADVKREPDAVKWLDNDTFIIANEGDYEGGSRGFTVFNMDGTEVFDSGLSFEYAVAAAGHYPEKRSGNKGVEPEGLAVGTFGETQYAFVLSERGSMAGVYTVADGVPTLKQLLPSGIAPEGAVAIPARGLFVTANEADLGEDNGPRAHVMIYALQDAAPVYPTIASATKGDLPPIAWGALSGLAADDTAPARLYAVTDSFYSTNPQILVIDAAQTPAAIVDAMTVTRDGAPAEKIDLEGISTDGEGGFWLASEGRTDREIPHALLHVDASGAILEEVAFPDTLLANEIRFGAEGVTKIGETLWIAMQREWKDDEKGLVKLVSYNLESGAWGAVHYPLETPETGWMGLSEITADGERVLIVERDNQIGGNARVKRLYSVPTAEMVPAELGAKLPVVNKTLVRDFLPDLAAYNGYTVDKLEGFAIDANGKAYAVTDNDGTDDSSGETFFWSFDLK